jgi:predicted RNase H-like HicB family nuclease
MTKDLSYYMGLSYKVEVIEDTEEGGYALSCPELPGCMTCATTVGRGMLLLKDAKRAWLEACIEDGYPVPEPAGRGQYSGQFKLRLPKTLHRELAEDAKKEGVSMNQLCIYRLSRNGQPVKPQSATKSQLSV